MRQFRIGLTTALAVYALLMLASPQVSVAIDVLNQPVHEAGHVLAAPLDDTLQRLGGPLLQLLLPLLLGAWCSAQRNEYGASIAAWWVGQSFTSMGVAMAAVSEAGPAVGGGDGDWAALFAHWEVTGHALQYGQLAHGFGFLIMLVATFSGLYEALHTPERAAVATPRYRVMARR